MTEVIIGVVAFLTGLISGVWVMALMAANGNDDDYEQWKYFNEKNEEDNGE